jgi:UDP-3-O-[3-hydroxymyristoyl] glucosamine N-acyltransferase
LAVFTPNLIAEHLEGRVVGPAELELHGLAEISSAVPGQLTFVGEAGYAARWAESGASAAIVSEGIELEPGEGRALIFVDNADLAMGRILDHLAPAPVRPPAGVHPTAVVDPSARVGSDVTIGPNCVVMADVELGDGVVLHAGVVLLDEVRIGAQCVLWPNVVVRERCVLGQRCVLEPGCVIGADGFGYRPDLSGPTPRIVKIPHLGNVILGDEVELGANVTVDRGKFDATVIGPGSKIDNQTQIGHNCKIGAMVVMSGCCAVAGSVTIGDRTLIGGAVVIRDHVTIGRDCKVAGAAGVAGDLADGGEYAGVPAKPAKQYFKELMATKKLPEFMKETRKSR